MTYEIELSRGASDDLGRMRRGVAPADRTAIDSVVRGLAIDPRPPQATQLVNSILWRLRVRSYRIIYEIDDAASVVYVVGVARWNDATYRDV